MKIYKSFFKNRRNGSCLFSIIKLGLLAIVIIVVALFFTMSYVADYALKSITAGTPITAGVGSVYINPFSQQLDLTNFYITNPQHFKYKGNAIAFKQVYVDADFSPSQYFSKKLIHIEEVKVDGLQVVLTIKSGTTSQSNLSEIVEILKKQAGVAASPSAQTSQKQQTADGKSEDLRIIIDKLVFKNSDIKAGYGDDLIPVPMPSFEIQNLGESQGGLTPGELTAVIIEKLTAEVTVKAISQLAKSGLKGLDSALKSGSKEAGSAIEAGTKGTENAVKSITEGLKNLF